MYYCHMLIGFLKSLRNSIVVFVHLYCINERYVYLCLCRFRITDLIGAGYFRVSLKFMICLEDGLPCEENVTILDNALLPKARCDEGNGIEVKSKIFTHTWFKIILEQLLYYEH